MTNPSQIATVKDELKISNFDYRINAGAAVTIQIKDKRFRNPPSTAPIRTFQGQSKRLDKSLIDQQVEGIVYKVNTPFLLGSDAISIQTSSGEINVLDTYTFTITLPLPMPVGSSIEITVPSTISIFSDIERRNLVLNNVIGSPPFYSLPEVTVLDSSAQKIRITNLVPLPQNYQDEGNPAVFSLMLMKNPGSTMDSPPFSVTIYDNESTILKVNPEGFTFAATPGKLSEINVTPDNYKVRDKVNYRFSFVTKNTLYRGGSIGIILPEEILVSPRELKLVPIQTVNPFGNVTFEYDETRRRLEIKNAFVQRAEGPSQVIFELFGL